MLVRLIYYLHTVPLIAACSETNLCCVYVNSQSPPVFGTVLYNVCSILRLTGPRIHCCSGPAREYLLKTMLEFVFRRSSKPPDRAIFLEILHVVEGWLKDPESLTGMRNN